MIPRGVRVLTLEFFFQWGVEYFFFLLRVEYFFFKSELHVHFAGCHILLLVQYCWCYHGRFKQGGGGGLEGTISNSKFDGVNFMGSNLSWGGGGGGVRVLPQENSEI